jgi:hypothetical protein
MDVFYRKNDNTETDFMPMMSVSVSMIIDGPNGAFCIHSRTQIHRAILHERDACPLSTIVLAGKRSQQKTGVVWQETSQK